MKHSKILLAITSILATHPAAGQTASPVGPAPTKVAPASLLSPLPAPIHQPGSKTTLRGESIAGLSANHESLALTIQPHEPATAWPVETSLKSTLRVWAQRQGWPEPQFLTEADWAVDVPGSVSGSIEEALKALAEGFGQAQTRPRIEVTGNHVILVSEVGAE